MDDWINEALAEYAAAIDSRRRLGEEGLGQWLERYRSSLETKPPPVGILGTSSGDSYRYANWYQRGALFFYCTEQRVGPQFCRKHVLAVFRRADYYAGRLSIFRVL